jgi:ParB-like chromosome segregation protein Spo0J
LSVKLPEAIVRRRCAALIPSARNARTHGDQQVAQIAASIREFGFTRRLNVPYSAVIPPSTNSRAPVT